MGDSGRQHEDLPLPDGNPLQLALLHHIQSHVSLDLEEELLTLLDVEVTADIGPAHNECLHLTLAIQHLVA